MKTVFSAIFSVIISLNCLAQDSTQKWQTSVGIDLTTVPTIHIAGTDTSFQNALSIAPFFTVRSKGGFGIIYSPVFVSGGRNPGIFMHVVTAGLEQYGKKSFDLVAEYTHFFFTNNTSIPTSPITNEVVLATTYKKSWIMPKLAAGFGFGTDNEFSPSKSVYDMEIAAGIAHTFENENGKVDVTLTPSVLINAGTNQYFSFLRLTKYISHSKKFNSYVKNPRAKSGSGNAVITSTQSSTKEKITLNNLELNLETSIEKGPFSIRPTVNLFIPFSSKTPGVEGYWDMSLTYSF